MITNISSNHLQGLRKGNPTTITEILYKEFVTYQIIIYKAIIIIITRAKNIFITYTRVRMCTNNDTNSLPQ